MPNHRFAESFLACFYERSRAAAMIGDWLEMSPGCSSTWLWVQVARTSAAQFVQGLYATPGATLHLAMRGYGVYLTAVATTAVLQILFFNLNRSVGLPASISISLPGLTLVVCASLAAVKGFTKEIKENPVSQCAAIALIWSVIFTPLLGFGLRQMWAMLNLPGDLATHTSPSGVLGVAGINFIVFTAVALERRFKEVTVA